MISGKKRLEAVEAARMLLSTLDMAGSVVKVPYYAAFGIGVDTTNDGIPDKWAMAMDTTGDHEADQLGVDTTGDGIPDKLIGLPVDTTGDGVADHLAIDTIGDEKPDTLVPMPVPSGIAAGTDGTDASPLT
jgi:hypothetical protein